MLPREIETVFDWTGSKVKMSSSHNDRILCYIRNYHFFFRVSARRCKRYRCLATWNTTATFRRPISLSPPSLPCTTGSLSSSVGCPPLGWYVSLETRPREWVCDMFIYSHCVNVALSRFIILEWFFNWYMITILFCLFHFMCLKVEIIDTEKMSS